MSNSVVYVVVTIFTELVLGGLAAYALARRKPPGSDALMLYFLVASTVPVWMYIVPLFIQWRTLKLLNTMHGLIIIYVAMNAPLTIFLLRSYMIDLPRELEDAARVDGGQRIPSLDAHRHPPDQTRLLDRWLGGWAGCMERIYPGAYLRPRSQPIPCYNQLFQIHRPLCSRLGANQCRRRHHHLPGGGAFPGYAASIHRGLGGRRRQNLRMSIDLGEENDTSVRLS